MLNRAFEEVFIREQIPYRLIGGTKFYERKEIKDVLSYARLILNPQDSVSQQRLIKLGKRKFEAFTNWLAEQVVPTATQQTEGEPLTAEPESNTPPPPHPLLSQPPQQLLQTLIKQTNYLDRYDERLEEDQQRIDNVLELLAMAGEFSSLAELLESIALLEETDNRRAAVSSDSNEAVNLMSLHAAKGLEFDTVFLVGMEEGLLPHSRSLFDPVQLEEERRLCYVGITRAKRKMVLSYSHYRLQYGASTTTIPSRFLSEIPGELFDHSQSQKARRARASHPNEFIDQSDDFASGKPSFWNRHKPGAFSRGELPFQRGRSAVGSANSHASRTATHTTKSAASAPNKRRIVSDDDLDAFLHGELDAAAFLDR